ncbi:ABC transporter substrate-binding protein [Acidisphaera sp. S103]|uniref:ABC transporter substrate-binding protein n=1 Tax=Acidisphaera sp. S103 TaxID=1747223 RepID=UPI00131AEA18|nr:ABC transporter substrate-binding protein [Acidisphaera sp. S103]
MKEIGWIGRRDVVRLLGIGGAALAAGLPAKVHAAASGGTLVLGIDISDSITFDPAREAQYTAPLSLRAAYESLVTMSPGDYLEVKPALASSWAKTSDGKGWRFHLADAKFNSGNPVTADDVKWTFERLINLKDQPSQYVTNISAINVIDPKTVDLMLVDPTQPILAILSGPNFGVMEQKAVAAQGGTAATDAPTADKATNWLNQHSAGAGPFTLVGWTRGAQILLTRNEHYFRGPVQFEHVIVRHMGDSATQLLAIKRGDVGAAFNLIPEQIATLKDDKEVRVEGLRSLDFVYMALTNEPAFNKALAVKEARQAIACAIDYDGIIKSLLGGTAMRCASFIPIGLYGSTEETTKQLGWHQDLDRAKQLLQKAGLSDGFEFKLSYGDAAVSGLSYAVLAQKLQSDLARVGIKVVLDPIDQVNLRTQYTTGKSTGGVLTFWNPSGVETDQWASASVLRVAKRIHWTPDPALTALVRQAAAEQDTTKRTALYVEYQKALLDQASLQILFQPIYQFAVRDRLKTFPLTAAGWEAELYQVTT